MSTSGRTATGLSIRSTVSGTCCGATTTVRRRPTSPTSTRCSAIATELAAIGAAALPLSLLHGDFAEWNVHYLDGELAGAIDFALSHLDSRPYELAIARTHRSPETIASYSDEMAALGWPLSDLE